MIRNELVGDGGRNELLLKRASGRNEMLVELVVDDGQMGALLPAVNGNLPVS